MKRALLRFTEIKSFTSGRQVVNARTRLLCLLLLCSSLIAGCASQPQSRYSIDQDIGPTEGFDASRVPDAVPRYEVRTKAGNKSPYTILGETYYVLESNEGFKQKGIASWYGKKFHGHKTSNGEVYSMYGMTATHKTLPIPSYVRVTNTDNGRTVIVRVNDRGPFHEGRVIDLSYAAAQKLGYADKGTANVELEVINTEGDSTTEPYPAAADALPVGHGYYVQVGAYTNPESAQKVKKMLEGWAKDPVLITRSNESGVTVHRVRVGPFTRRRDAEKLHNNLQRRNFGSPIILVRPLTEKAVT